MSDAAVLRTDERDGVLVARLVGEVDLSNARELGADLAAQVSNTALGVVVDLSQTSYLDSSGVQLMFELAERLDQRQQQLGVAVPEHAPIRRVLKVVQLGAAVPIESSVDDAVARLREAA